MSRLGLVLFMVALACLLLGLALWLFARARRKEQLQSVQQHLQRNLGAKPAMAMPGAAAPQAAGAAQPGAALPSSTVWQSPWLRTLDRWLGVQAWGIAPATLALLAGGAVLLTVVAGMQGGLALAVLALAVYAMVCAFFIWRRLARRRARVLQQLPGFLDNMVRLISIGNSPHAAFQLAVKNVEAPLGDALQQAAAMVSVNPDMGEAMAQLERRWGLPEFGLLAAVFRMSVRYGGRADLVLERVSAYIRDRQAAEMELHAMSAEIRLSAWILALLPIGVGALIMVLNAGYFLRMWEDPSGRNMIFMAAGLEAFGALLLYRLARLK